MKNIIILVLLTTFTSSFANNILKKGVIKGQVIDMSTNQAVEYATISIFNVADSSLIGGGLTDELGKFELLNIPFGKFFLNASFIGFKKETIENIVLNKKYPVFEIDKIELIAKGEELEEVVVLGERNKVEYKVDKKVVNVSQYINASGGTAADVLENVPSIKIDIEGNVTLRGSSGFKVLVDGRPSPVSASDLLEQIPANSIKHVEIITNPSAKFDPDGTAGIINIIMKKVKLERLNGVFTGVVNSKVGVSGTANMNMKRNKLNYFINLSYTKDPTDMDSENDRETYFFENTRFLDEDSKRTQTIRPWRVNLGTDFDLNDKNYLSVSGTVGGFGFFRDFDAKYHSYDKENSYSNYSISESNFSVDGIYYAGNFFYQHKFASQNHNFELTLGGWQWLGNDSESSFSQETNIDYIPIESVFNTKFKSLHSPTRNNLRAKLDYVRPLFNGKLEAGFQSHITEGNSIFTFENFDFDNSKWFVDDDLSNGYDFDRGIYAFYSTYSNQIKGYSYKVGLRLENTFRKINQPEINKDYTLELFNYYPSVHISKAIGKTNQLQVSYSKRINRPQPWELHPFSVFGDNYNIFYGNPLLEPEDVDSYEFNYIKRFSKVMASLGLYYRETDNTKIFSINFSEEYPDKMIVTYENLDKTTSLGAEVSFNYDLNEKISTSIGGNFYKYKVSSIIANRSQLKNSLKWDSRLNATYKLSNNTRFQLTASYNGPGYQGQGFVSEFYLINMAFRHDFLDRKATFTINVRDVFASSKYEQEVNTDDFYSYFILKNQAPVFRVSLSYRLNNYKRRRNIDQSGR